MIEIRDKRLVIDGTPRILLSGEVHYFRLQRDEWPDRLARLRAAGGNTVASYIPWLSHEPEEGHFDLDGHTRDALDLAAFIDLCHEQGLYFMARPGPFIMAEMKNEGIPYYVYERHPEIMPVGWDGKPAPTRTVDYLAPGFLHEVRRWYDAVMPILAARLQPNGGNIVAVQLDNEIGMLSWVSNSPDLTDFTLDDFWNWLQDRYAPDELAARYPFADDSAPARATAIRSPHDAWAPALHHDLGCYMRDRFARYVATLRGYAEENGVRDVPFIVNVHGTAEGRGLTFPIGTSQLYEAYTQAPGYLGGSDFYLGDLTTRNFADLYLINGFMDAVTRPGQPITAVEFEAGSGDYAADQSARYDPSAIDFKVRMCIAQGNRLLNYYLFTGGINYPLPHPVHDGNGRISFTGERHGTGAPVGPEGQLNYTYDRTARITRAVAALDETLATMEEEHDGLMLAFIPDDFMTETVYPGSERIRGIVDDLVAHRGGGIGSHLVRALLYAGYRFGCLDIQDRPLSPSRPPVLAVATSRFMAGGLQEKLVRYLTDGGHLLLYGEVPEADEEGRPCATLRDALGLTPRGKLTSSPTFFLSVRAGDWLGVRPEVRVDEAQLFGATRGTRLIHEVSTGHGCGFDVPVGDGRAVAITCSYPGDMALFRTICETLGAAPGLRRDVEEPGIFMTSTANPDGARLIYLMNLDGYEKRFRLFDGDKPLFKGEEIQLGGREALTLPLHLARDGVTIDWATAEIVDRGAETLEFRLAQERSVIALTTNCSVTPDRDCEIARDVGRTTVTVRRAGLHDDRLTLRFG
jgi:beta-galactosidase